jgi:hypothetical protein
MSNGFDDYEEEYQVGGSLDRGGKFLDGNCPGCYHLLISAVKRPAVDREGMPIENALANVQFVVAAPEVHKDKTGELTLWLPKLDSKDGGAFGQKKNDRFLAAIGEINPDDVDKRVRVNWSAMAGRQFLVKLETKEIEIKKGKNKGQKRAMLDVAFAEFYHVDDPEAGSDYPRNESAIKMIPAKYRRLKTQAAGAGKSVDDMDI